MTRKYDNHRPKTNLQHSKEETQNTNNHMTAITQSNATSSLFLKEMITKLKRTQSTT